MEIQENFEASFADELSGDAFEVTCIRCGSVEWVIPLDAPLDPIFLANYYCDDCD